MNILVDENIPVMTVKALRDLGHKVLDHRGTSKEGLSDEDLWQVAVHEKALFVTTDKGFSNKREEAHFGIVIWEATLTEGKGTNLSGRTCWQSWRCGLVAGTRRSWCDQ